MIIVFLVFLIIEGEFDRRWLVDIRVSGDIICMLFFCEFVFRIFCVGEVIVDM